MSRIWVKELHMSAPIGLIMDMVQQVFHEVYYPTLSNDKF